MKQRTCGECTACCNTHQIPTLGKPALQWCAHCQIGAGCRVYETRPEECREYSCLWLQGSGTEGDRPDKSLCVIDIDTRSELGYVLSISELAVDAWKGSTFARDEALKAMGRGAVVLICHDGARDQLLIPANFRMSEEVRRIAIENQVAVHRYHIP